MADEPGQLTSLEREGLAWADRIAVAEATAEDFAALEHWCAQSPQHLAAFEAAMELQSFLAANGAAAREALRSEAHHARHSPVFTTRRTFFGGGAVAAGLAAYLAYNPPLHLWPSMRELGATFRTDRSETKTIALAGAKIEFDRGTAATMNQGQLQLIEGAVLVDGSSVQHVRAMSNEGTITASQSAFNLSRLDDVSCLTCVSGQVELVHTTSQRKLSLSPGQQVQYTSRSLEPVGHVNLSSTLAWRRGFMVFSETPLVDVLKQINHYRGGRIILTNAALGQKPFNGVFRIGDFTKAISEICLVTGVKASSLPGDIVLLG